jgi:hypothetical protein
MMSRSLPLLKIPATVLRQDKLSSGNAIFFRPKLTYFFPPFCNVSMHILKLHALKYYLKVCIFMKFSYYVD